MKHLEEQIVAGAGLFEKPRKSLWPARLDTLQSASGLALALFMWGHMFLVASILISERAMWTVTKVFEGYFLFGRSYPIIVSLLALCVFLLLMLHAALAMRKFPANYRQYRTFLAHRSMIRHEDTTLWWVQVITGFALFFLASIHLYQMIMHPGDIGPYASSDRVWTGNFWPLYIVLLLAVELHGGIGLYRLSVKWGWWEGRDPAHTLKRLKQVKWALTAFFLVLGAATLAAYIKIGIAHQDQAGQRFVPEASVSSTLSGRAA